MTAPLHPLLDDQRLWTRQRQELVQWFDDNAPSFTSGYVAAVRLLYDSGLPARVNLISHLVRDIYHKLPSVFGIRPRPRVGEVFPPLIRDLVEAWEACGPHGAVMDDRPPGGSDELAPMLVKQVSRIVERSKELGPPTTVGTDLARALFQSVERREDEFIPPALIDAFDRDYDFFVKRAHLRAKGEVRADGLADHFEAFERTFHSLVGPYFTGKEELDVILLDANKETT